MAQGTGKTLLIFSQVFVPDPASVGQHMADVAFEMARRGHRVVVYTANRGYENPAVRYPARETRNGVEIRRLSFASFGKRNLVVRALGTLTFLLQCVFIALFTRNLGGIFFSTSPPLIGAAAAVTRMIRGVPIAYWAMDLNPDQLIAMGKVSATSFTARTLERVNRFILKHSNLVFALDRFMARRLRDRGVPDSRMVVMPPWPHEDHIEDVPQDQNPFRLRHGLAGKLVIMYSGNHSPANPLRTLLDATLVFQNDDEVRFLFVGGGLGKKEVEQHIAEHSLTNVVSLPYQPLEELGNSLGAADVHVVSLGKEMVGIIHPCKIYGAMTVGRPVLFLGPAPSHIADLLEKHDIGWHVEHGDTQGAIRILSLLKTLSKERLSKMGAIARRVLNQELSQVMLCGRFCDHLERVFRRRDVQHPTPALPGETEVSCVQS